MSRESAKAKYTRLPGDPEVGYISPDDVMDAIDIMYDDLVEEPVDTFEIADGAVTAAKIADDTITAAQIAANAVGASELADNAVDTNAIADSAVTTAKIADGTITSTDVAADTFAAFGTVGNLLTANQASGTDTLGTTVGFESVNACTLASSTAQAAQGTRSLLIAATANSPTAQTTGGTAGIPVTVGDTYTVSAQVRVGTATGRTASVGLRWFTAAGAVVGSVNFGAEVTLSTSWQTISKTEVAPATAAFAALCIKSQTAVSTETFYVDCLSLHRGVGGQWAMPGVPIVGGSSIATNGAYVTSGTVAPEGVITAPPLSRYQQTSGAMTVTGTMEWVKASGTGATGWVAGAEADTGWRDVSSLLVNGWAYSGYPPTMRRIGSRVVLEFGYRLNGTSATSTTVLDVPAGFQRTTARQGGFFTAGVVMANSNSGIHASTGNTDLLPAGFDTNTGGANGVTVNSTNLAITGRLEWETVNAWPSSLPGSAV